MRRNQSGFTLAEIAIVLVIIALMTTFAVGSFSSFLDNNQRKDTQTRQQIIVAALQGFVAKNYRLPCPADPTLASTAALYGLEAATPGTCTGLTGYPTLTPTNVYGVFPWVSLGLDRSNVIDGYGNYFTYAVVLAETNRTNDTISRMRGNMGLHSSTPAVFGLQGTGGASSNNQINACSTSATDNSSNLFGVVAIVSHGKNGLGAYTPGGTRNTLPSSSTNPGEYENTDNNLSFVTSLTGIRTDSSSTFDDTVVMLAPDDILFPLGQTNMLPTARAVTSTNMLAIRNAVIGYMLSNQSANGTSACNNAGSSPKCRQVPDPDSNSDGIGTATDTPTASGALIYANVPYLQLGLQQAQSIDGWGTAIRYYVDNTLGNYNGLSSGKGGGSVGLSTTQPSGSTAVQLVSAGSDMTFGTSDDITVTLYSSELRGIAISNGTAIP